MPRLRLAVIIAFTLGIAAWDQPWIIPYMVVSAVSAVAGCCFGFMLADSDSEE